MYDKEHVPYTVKKIMQSMKTKEKISCLVKSQYLIENDQELIQKYDILTDRVLYVSLDMKELVRVEDLYKDQTTFYKTLKKGFGSASPYMDCLVACKLKFAFYSFY